MAKKQVEKTIQIYESLVSEFPSAESWAVNILEASKLLTTGIAQTNFYRYLFDPTNYLFQSDIKTISKKEEDKYNAMVAKFDAENLLDVKVYKNGSDVKIIYIPNKDLPNTDHASKETKPVARVPQTVQSQKQKDEYEASHESGSETIQIQEEKVDE